MYDAENVEFKFSRLRRHLKGELQRQNKLISSKRLLKSCKMRPKSLQSAKPFSRYSNFKIKIWTISREKTREKPKMLFFRSFARTEEQ